MLIDRQPGQKNQRICFGASWDACSVWDTKQQLYVAASCSMLANAASSVGAGAAAANLQREQCLSMGGRRRNGGASVSGAYWVHEAPETLSSSLALRHHDQMQADAVSQRAAWVLVPRPLNCRLSDAVSTHVVPRNGGASVSGADGTFAAYGARSRCLAMYHHDQMLANAVSQRAA